MEAMHFKKQFLKRDFRKGLELGIVTLIKHKMMGPKDYIVELQVLSL